MAVAQLGVKRLECSSVCGKGQMASCVVRLLAEFLTRSLCPTVASYGAVLLSGFVPCILMDVIFSEV